MTKIFYIHNLIIGILQLYSCCKCTIEMVPVTSHELIKLSILHILFRKQSFNNNKKLGPTWRSSLKKSILKTKLETKITGYTHVPHLFQLPCNITLNTVHVLMFPHTMSVFVWILSICHEKLCYNIQAENGSHHQYALSCQICDFYINFYSFANSQVHQTYHLTLSSFHLDLAYLPCCILIKICVCTVTYYKLFTS